jgi:hypothetical protein
MDFLSRWRHFLLIRHLRKILELEIRISDETVKTIREKDTLVCIKDGLYQRPLLTAGFVGDVSEDRTYVKVYVTSPYVLKTRCRRQDKSYESAEEEGRYDYENSV